MPRIVELDVERLAADGAGEGFAQQRHIRAKGALPGERVQVRIINRSGGTWWGLPERWDVRSPARRPVPCPAFLGCGGCVVQHLDAATQLEHKQQAVLEALDGAGVAPASIRPPEPGPQFLYRRKARLGARYLADKDEFLLGFRESFGSRVARLDGCLVLAEPFSSQFRPLRELLGGLEGCAVVPQLEIAVGDGQAASPTASLTASLAIRHLEPLNRADVERLDAFQGETGIQVLLQAAGYDTLVRLDGGPERPLSYRLDEFGIVMEFGISDFVQVNARVNERLVSSAMALLAARPGERILDLFCGLGNFSLPIARSGACVVGVEASPAMVRRAAANAQRNALHGVCFRAADLYAENEPLLADPLAEHGDFDKVVVDPPRTGCGTALSLLTQPSVERVVYVSCHPESFARDAGRLRAEGFNLKQLQLFDMFPHTAHVETLAQFERG